MNRVRVRQSAPDVLAIIRRQEGDSRATLRGINYYWTGRRLEGGVTSGRYALTEQEDTVIMLADGRSAICAYRHLPRALQALRELGERHEANPDRF